MLVVPAPPSLLLLFLTALLLLFPTIRNRRRMSGQSVLELNQRESIWWAKFLAPSLRAELLMHRDGGLAKQFWKLFHTPFEVLVFLEDLKHLASKRFWQEWNEDNICCAGKLVTSLNLKILGSLFLLAHGVVAHVSCSTTCSNIGGDKVYRKFFTKDDEFVIIPKDDYMFWHQVTNEYAARRAGLPVCVGSVDCCCLTQSKHAVCTGRKKGLFPSVA